MMRYHMQNNWKMIEFPKTPEGLHAAKEYRKCHPEFKRRRIKEVWQAYPSEIEFYKEYRLNFTR